MGLLVSFFEQFCTSFSQSRFGVSISVSQSKKLKSLGLAEKNASLAVSQSVKFTIRYP